MNLFNLIFKRKRKKTKTEFVYIEKNTECDVCKFLEKCKPKLINITTGYDTGEHYMKGLGFEVFDCYRSIAILRELYPDKTLDEIRGIVESYVINAR